MKISYKYQPAPADTCHYGVDFIGGYADVTDPELIAKFKAHPHFEAVETAVEAPEQDDRTDLAAEYEAKFGKKPHHKMKADTIREALTNADND
jgi:hypothetical protein